MTITFPQPDAGTQSQARRAPGSAVLSHKSYERPARLLCHHSGQYLTVEESNPERIIWLREQHDFPAFKALDDRFQDFASPINYDHRIVLREPTDQQFAAGGEPSRKPVRFQAEYVVDPEALRSAPDSWNERTALTLAPQLAAFDSYTLVLTFRWAGAPFECALEECRLAIPPELGYVEQVERGRRVEENGSTEVIWRNLMVDRGGTLSLSVRFSNPLLGKSAPAALSGSYRFIVGGAVSGLAVPLEHIWDARGQIALPRTRPSVNASSVFEGDLIVHIAMLAQEHEHVATARVCCPDEPTGELVGRITRVLTAMGVDIQRIEEALPRLDPLGTLNHQLRYWDIIGRKYELAALEAVDVHIVISGSTRGQRASNTPTAIDIRVRCLHDPRSPQIAEQADNACKLIAEQLETTAPADSSLLAVPVGGGNV